MPKKILDLLRSVLPLNSIQKDMAADLEEHVSQTDLKEIIYLVKQKKAELSIQSLSISPQLAADRNYIQIKPISKDEKIIVYINSINDKIKNDIITDSYQKFSKNASKVISKFIAMNIVGMETVKKAVAVQLFATPDEPVHVLLLGDPGTGKTDILRSATDLAPISSFGLGSGTSSVGLTVTMKGDQVQKGLLPMADKGMCAIDELNLMQEKDRASLYNAMEKGFITYDKGGKHHKFDSKIKVIATANPKGDRFAGWTVDTIRDQLPFDAALLSRFHLVFLIRKPDIKQFIEISKKIVSGDKKSHLSGDQTFISDYVKFASNIDVVIPKEHEDEIVDFMALVKENEKRYLVEVGPRLVLGFTRLAKASARMNLRDKVDSDDIKLVKDIIMHGLRIDRA